jgi:DNA-binding NarL/FixJ family response regulator
MRNEGDLPARADAARIRWGLTQREVEILRFVALGDANRDIAARLSLALATVEVHVSAILRKARVESRARLIAKFWTA